MSGLFCNQCFQVPYVEFMPGLMVKFFCHEINMICHIDLDNLIENLFTLRCCVCQKESIDFYILSASIICDKCSKYKNIKNKVTNYLKNDSLLKKCKFHFTRYSYYDKESHLFLCEYCEIPKSAKKLQEYNEEFKENDKLVELLNSKNQKKLLCPKYYELLIKRIIQTYENYGNKKFNAYYNSLNVVNFLSNYSILSPFCKNCREIFHIKISDKMSNEDITLDVSCKCSELNKCSIKDFENKIDLNTCDNCKNFFSQVDLIYDNIFDEFLCQNCAEKKKSLDYIRFNEFIYICLIHKKSFDSYCSECGKLFCSECKNLNKHNIGKLNCENKEYPKLLNSTDWFLKLKNSGLLNLKYGNKNCASNSEIIKTELEKLIKTLEKEKIKSFENRNKLEQISSDIIQNLFPIQMCINNINLSEQIIDLKNENNQLKLSLETILKKINEKNALVNLVSTRNIFVHLIINIIKKNHPIFEKIKEDFRILYESYKYLNNDFITENDKHDKNILEKKLTDLISKFIELMKNYIKKKVTKLFVNHLKKMDENKKLNLKKEDINEYNKYLSNQKLISNKDKFTELMNLIDSLEKNEIPENIEKNSFTKFDKITGVFYNDQYGYINEKSINPDFIRDLLKNSQENENYQYLILKKEGQKDFLDSVKCKNDIEYYFLYSLIQNIIKRIGNIVNQNDKDFKFVFKDISKDLNERIYELIKDPNEKIGYKFIEKEFELNFKTIKLTYSFLKLTDFINFSKNFLNIHVPKLKLLIGEKKIKELRKKIEEQLDSFNLKNKLIKCIDNIENIHKEGILFYTKYKELFAFFPSIKENLADQITYNYEITKFKNISINYSNEIRNKEFTSLVNYFAENYLLTLYTRDSIRDAKEKYKNQYDKYEKLLEKNLNYEFSKIILESYQSKIEEENISDIFKQERDKLIDVFTKMKNNINKENYSKIQKDLFILKEQEIEKYNSLIEEMKSINIGFFDDKFENYLKDIDMDSFSNSKFDVILYLYQNKFL